MPPTDAPLRGTVLAADDDIDLLAGVVSALEDLGVQVFSVHDGAALIQQLAENGPFNLIVSDISMPWMNGLQAAQSIRTAGLDTPIIIMTALRGANLDQRVALLGGPRRLLLKPFDLAELQRTVRELWPHPQH